MFMQSVHRASRPHLMAYFIIARIYLAFLAKRLPQPILCVLITGQELFAGISKFV